AAKKRFGPLLTAGRRRRAAAAPGSRGCAASALRRRCAVPSAVRLRGAKGGAALPVNQLQPLAIEENLELLARDRSEAGRRHVVAEDRCHRDRVLAVGRKDVLLKDAAAGAKRKPFDVVVLRAVLGRWIHDGRGG